MMMNKEITPEQFGALIDRREELRASAKLKYRREMADLTRRAYTIGLWPAAAQACGDDLTKLQGIVGDDLTKLQGSVAITQGESPT